MHCVSEYPTKLDESQLGFIKIKKIGYRMAYLIILWVLSHR